MSQIYIHKYLGTQINDHLKWHSYVSYLCKKMAYCLLSHHHEILSVSILKSLVESLHLSHLNYTLYVWGPALAHDLLARLVKMHNHAVQAIGGVKNLIMSQVF